MDAFNEGFNGIPYDEGRGRQLMYSGQAAMMDMTISFLNNVREEAPQFEDKLGFFVFPTIEGGEGNDTQGRKVASGIYYVKMKADRCEIRTKIVHVR